MARSREVEAPAQNDVYSGMWVVTFLAVLCAVGLLCYELTEYGWESTPAKATAPALPNIPARTSPSAQAQAEPVIEKPAVAVTPKPATPAPAEPGLLPPAPKPAVVVVKPEEPKKVEPKATPTKTEDAPKPTGPVPGFELPWKK